MPHPDDIKHVRSEIRQMTREQISARLEEITQLAKARIGEQDAYILYNPSEYFYMTPEEVQERYELMSMFPTNGELAIEARERLQQRISQRGIRYVCGADVAFIGNDKYACDTFGLYETPQAAALKRETMNSSFPCEIYKVDIKEKQEVTRCFGFNTGKKTTGWRIIQTVGNFYDLLPPKEIVT